MGAVLIARNISVQRAVVQVKQAQTQGIAPFMSARRFCAIKNAPETVVIALSINVPKAVAILGKIRYPTTAVFMMSIMT